MATDIRKTSNRKLEIYKNNSYKRSLNLVSDITDFVFNDYFCVVLMRDRLEVYDVINGKCAITTNCSRDARLKIDGNTIFITENGKTKTYNLSTNLATNQDAAYYAGRQIGKMAFNVMGSLFKKTMK